MRKFHALTFIFVALFFVFVASTPAKADTTTDYNQKVAEAQAKINDLEIQLQQAQADLDSWASNSNASASQINDAQTAVFNAQTVLDDAAANYVSARNEYDVAFTENQQAEQDVATAVIAVNNAADLVDSTYATYVQAQTDSDVAQTALNQAQTDYDTKLINAGGQGVTPGLLVDVYTGINKTSNPPTRSDVVYSKCKTVVVSNIDANWGGGSIFGCASDYVMLHYRGYITYPTTTKVYFQAPADDGFYLSIAGQTIVNDWSLKGCGANTTGMFSFTANKSYSVDAWFYEWGGGACSTLNYKPVTSNSYSVVPGSMFSQDAVPQMVKDPALKIVLDAKTLLYVQAVAVEEQANQTYLQAESNYDAKYLIYSYANQSLSLKRTVLQNKDVLMQNVENVWQQASDSKAICDADLRDLKTQYASIFDAMDQASNRVVMLTEQLQQAKQDLANIPKPTAQDKRVPKKVVSKYLADSAYIPRGVFVPNPK